MLLSDKYRDDYTKCHEQRPSCKIVIFGTHRNTRIHTENGSLAALGCRTLQSQVRVLLADRMTAVAEVLL